jgi:hypothetical protein
MGYSQTPQNHHPVHMSAEEKQEADKKAQQHEKTRQDNEDYNLLQTLIFNCQSSNTNITIEAQAKMYDAEHILEKFPEKVAAFKAEQLE